MNAARKHSPATAARPTRPGRKAILWAAASIAMAPLAIGVSVTGIRGRQEEGKSDDATANRDACGEQRDRRRRSACRAAGADRRYPRDAATSDPPPNQRRPRRYRCRLMAQQTPMPRSWQRRSKSNFWTQGGDEAPAGTNAATMEIDAAAASSALTRVDTTMATTESGTESGTIGSSSNHSRTPRRYGWKAFAKTPPAASSSSPDGARPAPISG